MTADVQTVHDGIAELLKTLSEKPVEDKQIPDLDPVTSRSGSGGQTRLETVFGCPVDLCSFTITKVREILFLPVIQLHAPNF